jgi:hypothetical protein
VTRGTRKEERGAFSFSPSFLLPPSSYVVPARDSTSPSGRECCSSRLGASTVAWESCTSPAVRVSSLDSHRVCRLFSGRGAVRRAS